MKARPAARIVSALLASVACGSVEPIASCDPVGAATPLCGFQNPEDLALLPDRRHVLVSEYGAGGTKPGRISLLDLESGGRETLFAGGEPAAPGPWGAPDCKGPPTAAFSPHGIHLAPRADGILQLLVVQHGGRESVEMFQVSRAAESWTLAWRGCALAPDEAALNDVVALPEGGFMATRMVGVPLGYPRAALFGSDSGWVYAWTRHGGFSEVPGTRAPLPNGIELSADGEKIFLNATLGNEVRRIDRRTGAVEARAEVPLPDNSTWTRDGRLFVASLRGGFREIVGCMELEAGSCPAGFAIVALDPETMATEVVYEGGLGTPSGAGTVGLEIDGGLLIGTFAGDRVVRTATRGR
jgi:SMP-30/Gluconolactonase/LRE-like region